MNKKIIAKEWLFLISFLFFGLVVFPTLVSLIFIGKVNITDLKDFYDNLTTVKLHSMEFESYNTECFFAWFLVLFPYILFNFMRSIVWAIKQVKIK